VDRNFTVAEAIAVTGGRVAAVGGNAQVRRLSGPGTLSIDLKGRTVIPGLIDTHEHVNNWAEQNYGGDLGARKLRSFPINLKVVKNKEDVLKQIKAVMDSVQFASGEWVNFAGVGFGEGSPPSREQVVMFYQMDRYDLDKVTPDNPVAM